MGKTDIRDPERSRPSIPGSATGPSTCRTPGRTGSARCSRELVELFAPARCGRRRYGLGRAPGAGGVPVPQPGQAHRQAGADVPAAGGPGRHRADHRRHRHPRRAGRRAPGHAHGVRHLLLVSRSGPDAPARRSWRPSWPSWAPSVRIAACDVADRDRAGRAARGRRPGAPADRRRARGRGAGRRGARLADPGAAGAGAGRQGRRRRPPARADRATCDSARSCCSPRPPGVLGSPGQANYAAANAFWTRWPPTAGPPGLPGVSLAWGLWARRQRDDRHLAEADLARMARSGIAATAATRALALLDAALPARRRHLLAADARPPGPAPRQPADALPPCCARSPPAAGAARRPAHRRPPVRGRRLGRPARGAVRRRAAPAAARPGPRPGRHGARPRRRRTRWRPDAPFKELGFDSLTAVELRNRLAAATGLRLPATAGLRLPDARGARRPPARASSSPDGAPDAGRRTIRSSTSWTRLESGAGRASPSTTWTRGAVTARLESLLSKWKAMRRRPAADDAPRSGCRSASADEVLDFIDNELGLS